MNIIVLNSGKCSWGNCVFCGWGKDESEVNVNKLIKKFNELSGDGDVKLFCSGSFFDEKQFPKEFQEHVAKVMQGRTLYVESRPEFISQEALKRFNGVKLVVAMGLEAADDMVLSKLKKGITLKQFIKASNLIHEYGFKVKGYILVNPPLNYNGLLDKTVNFGKKYCDELVLINTYPHSKSELFNYWINGDWKPLSEEEFISITSKYDNVQLEPNNYSFIPKFPKDKQERLVGVSVKLINHPHFNVWQDYLSRLYHRPSSKDIAFFLPCSKRKPYYKSITHRVIRRALTGFSWYKRLHFIVISNPGVIPIEFSNMYPFNAYDWNEKFEKPHIMKEYIKINTERIINYLKRNNYNKIIAYFKPNSESWIALRNACEKLGLKVTNLVDEELFNKISKKQLVNPLMINSFKNKIKKELK